MQLALGDVEVLKIGQRDHQPVRDLSEPRISRQGQLVQHFPQSRGRANVLAGNVRSIQVEVFQNEFFLGTQKVDLLALVEQHVDFAVFHFLRIYFLLSVMVVAIIIIITRISGFIETAITRCVP